MRHRVSVIESVHLIIEVLPTSRGMMRFELGQAAYGRQSADRANRRSPRLNTAVRPTQQDLSASMLMSEPTSTPLSWPFPHLISLGSNDVVLAVQVTVPRLLLSLVMLTSRWLP